MKSWIDGLIASKAVFSMFASVAILELLFVGRLFRPDWFGWVVERHLFEVIVLVVLMQVILMLWQLLSKKRKPMVWDDLTVAQAFIDFLQSNNRAHSVHLLSCGLRSRGQLIAHLLDKKSTLKIEVLVQHPETAQDQADARETTTSLHTMTRNNSSIGALEVRQFRPPVSIRAVVVCSADRKPLWAALGWYVYRVENGEIRVKGRNHPTHILDASVGEEKAVLEEFCMKEFERAWRNATPYVPTISGSEA